MNKSIKVIPSMARQLEEIAKGADRGNLDIAKFYKEYESRQDEIGLIARSIMKVEEFTQSVVKNVKNSLLTIQSVIDSLERNTVTLKTKAGEQTSQSHQIATASEEMSQTITDIARNTASASEIATESMNIAQEGVVLSDKSDKHSAICKSFNCRIEKTMDALNQRVEEIGDIVTVIKI